jgi:hypothetical protein
VQTPSAAYLGGSALILPYAHHSPPPQAAPGLVSTPLDVDALLRELRTTVRIQAELSVTCFRGEIEMARGKSGFGGSWARPPRRPRSFFAAPKADEPPAPRKRDIESLLCEAMAKRVLVSLFYEDDMSPRSFGPSAVYHSTKGKVCVCGVQAGDDFHVFEVGKIRSASMTTTAYTPAPIDRSDARYASGIICAA